MLGVAALDLTGNDADNVLTGNAGNNRIEGLDGADDLDGAKGNDKLFGGAGDDELSGGKGKDKLYGGDQNDTLSGGKDADKLKGGYGDDRLIGGSGADKLKGDEGDDWLTGGKHADTFIFAGNFGIDTITDFKGSDRINLKDVNSARNFSDLKSNHASQAGDDVHLDYGANRLILANVDLDDLRADDFIF